MSKRRVDILAATCSLVCTCGELQPFAEESGCPVHEQSLATKDRPMRTQEAIAEMTAEIMDAVAKWPAFNSLHEGWGVLQEEVDELWDHVRLNQRKRDPVATRKEALQVAAMAIRIAVDCCTEEAIRK